MTTYDLRLRIGTRYGAPAGQGRHLARVAPQQVDGVQGVARLAVAVAPPPDERWERVDFFGNPEVEFAFRGAHAGVQVTMTARVERRAPPPPPPGPPWREVAAAVALARDMGPTSPVHFAGPSPLVPRAAAFADWALARVGGGASALEAARAVSRAIHEEFRYDGEATEVDTPVLEAFAARHGVCQDFSHVMIGCLRALGIPAGYVSGLIRTVPPPGRARLEGADAMHAWVMAWCGPGAGWVELDPTNDCLAGEDHVLVARGRDYADVAPVKGVLRLSGGQEGVHAVDVVPVDEAAA